MSRFNPLKFDAATRKRLKDIRRGMDFRHRNLIERDAPKEQRMFLAAIGSAFDALINEDFPTEECGSRAEAADSVLKHFIEWENGREGAQCPR